MTPPVYLYAVSRTVYSLFKVLFNFPSRYLFAIGLVLVFSLGWSLPPTLGCIPKQPDSKVDLVNCLTCLNLHSHGPFTLSGPNPGNHTQCWTSSGVAIPRVDPNTTLPSSKPTAGFGAGLFPLHSPLLGESWLVSFPPLSDMLKFSGYSRLIRGQAKKKKKKKQ